ncbi:MAG: tetratricopeptide repeat protein [Bdellovibrionales bacterium]
MIIQRLIYRVSIIFAGLAITACVSVDEVADQTLNMKVFEQRAPASMAPPAQAKDALKNKVHMRSQADYHFTMAEAHSLNGNSDMAIEEFRLTLVYDPDSVKVHLRLSGEFLKKGFISEAIDHAEKVIRLDGENTDAHMLLGSLYSSLRMHDRAMEMYEAVLKFDPKNDEAMLYVGAIHVEQKTYKKAIRVFKKVTESKDSIVSHLAHYYIGRVQLQQKNIDSAIVSFENSITLKTSFVESVLALGKVYEKYRTRDRAMKLYESHQEKYGYNYRIADVLGRMYMEDERLDEAYKQFKILEANQRDNLGVKIKLALILIEQKSYDKAATKLKEILRYAPESDKIRFYLGAVYEETRKFAKAIEQFEQIPYTSSFFVEASVHGSYLYKLVGDYPKAIAWMDNAIKNRPEVEQFYTLYVSLLDDKKQYKKALGILKTAEVKFPESTQIQFFLGSIQDKLGNKQATIASMKKVISLDENHVQAINYLAYTFAEMNENLDEAEMLANRAMLLKPDDAYITDTYGWILYKQGKYAEAVKTLEAAYNMKPNESIIAEHLGDAYYRYQLPTKALWMYQKAIELVESNSEKVKLNSKIARIKQASEKLFSTKEQPILRVPASVETAN